ncbi:carbon-nitrogen hydrolase family protein [Acidocella sp.]|uniref:carbon-nitrogen hydrolase family protein n=1 Tax=Acidocella sp. TaxID=50710 RepID=UPI003CFFC5BE
MKIALYQGPGCLNNVQAGFAHLHTQASKAKAQGANLLILPEMYLSGYNVGAEAALAQALPQSGLTAARETARALNIALVFGYPERVGENVANAAVLIGPDGQILLNYRKSHLFGDLDRRMFKQTGADFPIAELGGVKIGLLICYDIEFPEPARRLALAGADVILVPTAQMEPYEQVARHVIPTRAYENQVYIAYANHSGAENGLGYIGLSSICGPNGAVLAMAGTDETMLFADTDPAHHAAVRQADPFFKDRRPELYGPLSH